MRRYWLDMMMERDRRSGGRDGRQGVKGTGRYGIGGRDYDRGRDDEYDSRRSDMAARGRGSDMERGGRGGSQRGRQPYDRNYEHDMRYDDYEDYRDFEYNYDAHEMPLELTEEDIKKWSKKLENADGSHGAKFSEDQVIPIAKQLGIEFDKDKFTEQEFTMAVNMKYSDACKALREIGVANYMKPEPYIHLAKAFLCDEDFEGKPFEKLAIYYYSIVKFEE